MLDYVSLCKPTLGCVRLFQSVPACVVSTLIFVGWPLDCVSLHWSLVTGWSLVVVGWPLSVSRSWVLVCVSLIDLSS